jgi:hypothetical protein
MIAECKLATFNTLDGVLTAKKARIAHAAAADI